MVADAWVLHPRELQCVARTIPMPPSNESGAVGIVTHTSTPCSMHAARGVVGRRTLLCLWFPPTFDRRENFERQLLIDARRSGGGAAPSPSASYRSVALAAYCGYPWPWGCMLLEHTPHLFFLVFSHTGPHDLHLRYKVTQFFTHVC